MKSRVIFLLKYFTFWVMVFLVQKIFFLFFNYKESFQLIWVDWFRILYHGLPLDFSTSAYISFLPALLLAIKQGGKRNLWAKLINVYTYLILFVVLLLGVVDMNLYSYWGFKLDISPLIYLKTPAEAFASVEVSEIAILLVIFALLYFLFLKFYLYFSNPAAIHSEEASWKVFITGFLLSFLLIIPMRGGLSIAPVNLGRVYFHQNLFANHSAINVTWNTLYSITKRKNLETRHEYMDNEKAQSIFSELMTYPSVNEKALIKPGSNVLIIVLESFSNKIISSLGGEKGITPGLDSLYHHGLVFENLYASGDRSDKGLVSIFSGFPAQPTTSIIDYPHKVQSLPIVFEVFSDSGFSTAFFYGGNLNFANFRAYFTNKSIDRIITEEDFPADIPRQKWGVPDEYLFKKIGEEIQKEEKPFFYAAFTLSSHEPYDVISEPVFGTADRDALSRNAFHYTDSKLKEFLDDARTRDWWEKTLIVILADHGSRSPGNTANFVDEKFNIPMYWTGGAVTRDSIISKSGSQTDIPATLLAQFGYDRSKFTYSRDLLNPFSPSFVFYAFNNGFGVKDSTSRLIYDLSYNKTLDSEGKDAGNLILKGKAYLQTVSNDFIQRK